MQHPVQSIEINKGTTSLNFFSIKDLFLALVCLSSWRNSIDPQKNKQNLISKRFSDEF